MSGHILVRESRTGRQAEDDTVHLLGTEEDETICSTYKRKEVRTVRSLGSLFGDATLCDDCSSVADDML